MVGGNYELLCLENPLLDIQAVADAKFLEKYGLKANDAILAEEKHMGIYDDLLNNFEAKIIAGGAAQNTARGAQYILPPKSTVYIGCVGQDDYAKRLQKTVESEGVHAEYRYDEKTPTGRCGVVITGHDRSMVTDLAAANCYEESHLKQPKVWELVEKAQVYFVGGYHLTVCVPAILSLAKHAVEKNKPFILSLSAPFIPVAFKDQLNQTAPYWDYVIGNETEAASYAEANSLGTTDVAKIAEHLARLPKENAKRHRVAVITQGTEPTIVATARADGSVDTKTYPVLSISKEQINDTNGAGDAFAGGFVAGVVQGKDLETCVRMGQWLAKLSIQELGPSYPYPKQTFA